jgi:hypothetical protein
MRDIPERLQVASVSAVDLTSAFKHLPGESAGGWVRPDAQILIK